jgi:hypothetical protein
MSTNKDAATEQPSPQLKPKLPLAFLDGPATPLLPAEPTAMQTIAGVMGNVLEWYDFALFGFFRCVELDVSINLSCPMLKASIFSIFCKSSVM